ncbi:MAG TPA: DUF6527 family protein [Acidobacteriaceae bacterium]|nr:DUF6527 family protein [Acidobacteriaceae bacterium]
MIYSYQAVERIPKLLSDGVVYHNEEFQLAALRCACGCGHRITLLVPDSHQVSSKRGLATIRPSIAVCDAPCKSHYFVTAGKVEWLPAFTQAQASNVMRNQIARHASHDRRPSWIETLWAALKRAAKRVRSLLRLFSI